MHVAIMYCTVGVRSATLNLGQLESGGNGRPLEQTGRSPRIGKRELQQQRRSRTIGSLDDTETVKKKQKPVRASDELKVRETQGRVLYALLFLSSLGTAHVCVLAFSL